MDKAKLKVTVYLRKDGKLMELPEVKELSKTRLFKEGLIILAGVVLAGLTFALCGGAQLWP